MSGLIHRNDALKEKITASNIVMGTGSDKTDTVEKRIAQLEDNKQGLLIEGENIRITENQDGTAIISAIVDSGTDVTVTPLLSDGTHIADIAVDGNNFEIYAPNGGGQGTVTDVLVDGESVVNQDGEAEIDLSGKQDVLTAGQNVAIQNNVISAMDTTYVDFVGATDQSDGLSGLVPSPTISDKDKCLKGDGTWGEAGGGNVDDILMNGQSIVINKIASFQNYVELTQSEYDALPSSKYTDGILYCIKDTGIVEGEKFAPVIYSLEEREIGVYMDGKPLYQKTIDCGALPDSTSKSIAHNIANLDTIVKSFGHAKAPVNQTPIPFVNNTTVGSQVALIVDSTNIILRTNDNRSTYIGYVTLQYTKTTDIPGSGTWGTDGVPMVHYDGNEKVIGTWFGETLYEKTLQFTLDSTTKGNWVSFNHGISNIDQIVNASGFVTNDNGIYYSAIRFANYSSYSSYVQGGGSFSLVAASRVDVGFQIGSDIPNSYNKLYATIQYTKSS